LKNIYKFNFGNDINNEKLYEETQKNIETHMLITRGIPVLLDTSLDTFFEYEEGTIYSLIEKSDIVFPEDFRIKLNDSEINFLKQKGLLSEESKIIPNAYTYEGISMLLTLLEDTLPDNILIGLFRAFRRFNEFTSVHKIVEKALMSINEIKDNNTLN